MDTADTTISDSDHALGRPTGPATYWDALTATAAAGIGVLGLLTILWRHTDPQRTIFFTPRLYAIVQPGTLIWPTIVDVWFVFSYLFSMGALRFGQALSR